MRDLTGRASQAVRLGGDATIGSLLQELAAEYGPAFSRYILAPDRGLAPHVRLFVNDEVVVEQAWGRPLADGDTVALFSAISGG